MILSNNMKNISIIEHLKNNPKLMRYFVMAVIIVGLEMVIFQITYLVSSNNYQLATIVSFISGVILNWIGGRVFIFGKSHYRPSKEFTLIFVASLVGLAIQLAVVTLLVEYLAIYPFFAKTVSIVFSFFWNYWFRVRFVYRHFTPS